MGGSPSSVGLLTLDKTFKSLHAAYMTFSKLSMASRLSSASRTLPVPCGRVMDAGTREEFQDLPALFVALYRLPIAVRRCPNLFLALHALPARLCV